MKGGFYKLCSSFVALAFNTLIFVDPLPRCLVVFSRWRHTLLHDDYSCGASFPVFTVPRCQSTCSLSSRWDDGILLEIIPNWRTTESLCRGILSDHGCLCVVQVNHTHTHVHTDNDGHDCLSRPKGMYCNYPGSVSFLHGKVPSVICFHDYYDHHFVSNNDSHRIPRGGIKSPLS